MNVKNKNVNENLVYLLKKGDKVVYVGQTTAGLNRIYQHLHDSCKKDFDNYETIKCHKNKLDEIECLNIIKFEPKYNKNLNGNYVKRQYILGKLKEKIGINPFGSAYLSQIIGKSSLFKNMFKGDYVILKKDADKLINFLINIHKNNEKMINKYFEER